MPNRVHGIVILKDGLGIDVGAGFKPAPTNRHALPEIIRAFKTFSSRRINQRRKAPGLPVWQRNYYEHLIRNHDDLDHARQYILDNSAKWLEDGENPQNAQFHIP
jgi:putative transposase